MSLRMVFKDHYRILMAGNGAEAMEIASRNPVDVAILDIRMPEMSGTELLGRLKAIDPDMEILMLTAYETIETARQALRLGACDYLNKPFELPAIRAAVSSAFERRTLSNQVRQNTEKLQQLQEDIQSHKLQEEMHRTRGEIYASIIHDINGPLTIISGFFEIINQKIGNLDRLEGDDLAMIKDRLARMTRQVSNCIEISRRYLSLLRERSTARTRVECNQILTDLWELVKFHPSLRNNKIIIKPLVEDVELEINGTDLIQTLLNLTINGLQATDKQHQVEVSGEILRQPLKLGEFVDGEEERFVNREGLLNDGPLLALFIQDDGPGIPPDIIERIFTTYFTTKGEGKGTGLGLTIVQRLVKENQGALHLQTHLGQGTVFTIYLPLSGTHSCKP